ncbi:MAG: LytTR family DNA-binding domain-containing protein [Bacteroidales bacterium]|nr:LytTR family DNA-binding domain-containing protein [Bacteroidales bacterium]MCF8343296.1 LytTR family DNA-binding domain-containing protein [Bacteroidales bacterium]MCF8375530.1 LytTR family DNA-binding domain-containing protein [Bacteroidales bacterium]MCF8399929.1 LytTR family DNA-binding domain-containing protein [Bacteroidales bacterium]
MKVLIVEDEAIAAEKLELMLKEIDPGIKVVAKTASVKESINWLLVHHPDLIFLDIQLSDGISFSIFEQVNVNTPVIFTTAYDQYSIKAFELNSIAYLLKPIRKSDLIESLNKFRKIRSAFAIDFESLMLQMQGREEVYKKRFLVQIGNTINKIETVNIAYFFILEKGVYLRTFSGKTYPLETSLDKLEQMLDPARFFRINRKYIVNMDSIMQMTSYSRSRVKLKLEPEADDPYDTIVSVERSPDFKKWLNS